MHQLNRPRALLGKRISTKGSKYSTTAVGAVFAFIITLLFAGYLGVNVANLGQTHLLALRLISLSLIVTLIFAQIHQIEKKDRPVIFIGAVALLGCFTSFASLNILFICLFALSARKISVDYLASASASVLGCAIIVILFLVWIGVIENDIDVTGLASELSDGERIRSTFGFKNVNAFASLVSAFCLLLMLTWRRAVISCVTSLFISFTFYNYTDSRALPISVLFFIFSAAFFSILIKRGRALTGISIIIIVFPLLLTLLSTKIVDEFPIVDAISSYRFTYSSLYFSEIPLYRFIIGGVQPSEGITVDNSFSLLTGAIGLPMLGYMSARLIKIIKECIAMRDAKRYAFLLSFWVFSFLESNMIRPESLIGVIFWLYLFYAASSRASLESLRKHH